MSHVLLWIALILLVISLVGGRQEMLRELHRLQSEVGSLRAYQTEAEDRIRTLSRCVERILAGQASAAPCAVPLGGR